MNKGIKFENSPQIPKKLQVLSRHEMIARIYQDILFDMTICKIEGWNVLEYPKRIIEEINKLLKKENIPKKDCEQLNLF